MLCFSLKFFSELCRTDLLVTILPPGGPANKHWHQELWRRRPVHRRTQSLEDTFKSLKNTTFNKYPVFNKRRPTMTRPSYDSLWLILSPNLVHFVNNSIVPYSLLYDSSHKWAGQNTRQCRRELLIDLFLANLLSTNDIKGTSCQFYKTWS